MIKNPKLIGLILTLFLIQTSKICAQQEFTYTAGILSGISFASGNNISYDSWESTPAFSSKIRFNIGWIISKNSAICSGIEFSYIANNTKTVRITEIPDGMGHTTFETTKYNLFYTGIPLVYQYKFKKMGINIGIQTLFLSDNKIKQSSRTIFEELEPGEIPSYQLRWLNHQAKKFDFGPQIELFYKLNPKISIIGSSYFGLRNISHESDVDRKNRQFTLGLAIGLSQKNTD